MKNLTMYVILLCLFNIIVLSFTTCSNEDSIQKSSKTALVNQAKKWFNHNAEGKISYFHTDSIFELIADWDYAEINTNDSLEIVEVPLISNKRLVIDTELDGVPYYACLEKEVSSENYFKLIIVIDKKQIKNIYGYNMVVYSDISKGVSIKNNSYLQKSEYLNAFVAFYDFKSNFIKGEEYVHGKLINSYFANITKSGNCEYSNENGICYKKCKDGSKNVTLMQYCNAISQEDSGGAGGGIVVDESISYQLINGICIKKVTWVDRNGNTNVTLHHLSDPGPCYNNQGTDSGGNSGNSGTGSGTDGGNSSNRPTPPYTGNPIAPGDEPSRNN